MDMNYLILKVDILNNNFSQLTVFSIYFIICIPMQGLGPCKCLHGHSVFVAPEDWEGRTWI